MKKIKPPIVPDYSTIRKPLTSTILLTTNEVVYVAETFACYQPLTGGVTFEHTLVTIPAHKPIDTPS